MIQPGDIITYLQLCTEEKMNLQHGMNYRPGGRTDYSIFLMNQQENAKYPDHVLEDGKVLIYEGHDLPNYKDGPNPKAVDQPERSEKTGSLTRNGTFKKAALDYKAGNREPECIRVYEKIKKGLWVFNGCFDLVDCWDEYRDDRRVFKFRLRIRPDASGISIGNDSVDLVHNRIIPSHVKHAVWVRDKGECVSCGSKDNLHFDHIIPFSKGGSSLTAENIQLLCARHNLQKSDKIQ